MTIAQTDREIKELIDKHHVYGAETVINALVRACDGQDYLGRDAIVKMLDSAYARKENE